MPRRIAFLALFASLVAFAGCDGEMRELKGPAGVEERPSHAAPSTTSPDTAPERDSAAPPPQSAEPKPADIHVEAVTPDQLKSNVKGIERVRGPADWPDIAESVTDYWARRSALSWQ